MIVTLLQAVRLPPGPKGKDYPRGTHEVPDGALSHPFAVKLIQLGLIQDGEKAKAAAPISEQARAQKLLDKLTAKAKAPAPVFPQGAEPTSAAPAGAPEAPAAPPAGDVPPSDQPAPPAGDVPPNDQLPPEKSEQELMADLQAEEDAKKSAADKVAAEKVAAEKASAEKAKAASGKNKQHK